MIIGFMLPSFLSAGPSIHEFTQAIEDSPEDMKYKFYVLRGKAYKDSGEFDYALKDFNTSIKLDPSRVAYIYRGEIYLAQERYLAAVNDFTAALEINPDIELYKLRGESYLKSANHVLALADGLMIMDMAPKDFRSYYISIEALENLGDIGLARELAFKVSSLDRGNKKANEIITKYPLQFLFISEPPYVLYISRDNYVVNDKANEIFLRYKRGEELDENIKEKLEECTRIGVQIKEYQGRLKVVWDNYFDEVRILKVRSRKIHDDLRTKYQKQSEAIEHETDIWEKKSEKCAEELVQIFWSNE